VKFIKCALLKMSDKEILLKKIVEFDKTQEYPSIKELTDKVFQNYANDIEVVEALVINTFKNYYENGSEVLPLLISKIKNGNSIDIGRLKISVKNFIITEEKDGFKENERIDKIFEKA
jgi:hypothetical protein